MAYTVNPTIPSLPFVALGGQPGFEPASLESYLAASHIAMFSYVRSDGRPNQAPLWYTYRDGTLLFVVATGSAKHRALQRDNRVCVAIQDERPPYRAVMIDGTVELDDLGDDGELSHEMAVRYFGKVGANEYDKLSSADRERTGQTLIRLVPSDVKGFDNTRAINAALLGYVRLRDRLPIPRRWL
ncbi:MAG: PPOX class F420-dependent oxidoreductase [Ilumatobacter sp.]|uniref:PPOX class F420-dependent oxidoreductase n=1 Tax=Ilumatobacter sp. TaxID=1967498 RepID=UPI003C785621